MADMKTHVIEVLVHGEPKYVVDVPTHQGELAAVRRAFYVMWSRMPRLEPEHLQCRPYGQETPFVGGPDYRPGDEDRGR